MYNLNGILYRLFATGFFVLSMGIIVLIISKFWDKEKVNTACMWGSIFVIVVGLLGSSYYIYKYINPTIDFHEGYYVEEYRDSSVAPPFPFTYRYVFTDGDNPKPSYCMDAFSRKDIYPDDFLNQMRYRIYYEKSTKIIVRIELIESPDTLTLP